MYTRYDKSSNILTEDTGAGPTAALWKRFPIQAIIQDPSLGVYFFDDFHDLPAHGDTSGAAVSGALGRYSHYIYTGGAIADGNTTGGVGGVAKFSSDGDNEGAAIGPLVGGFNLATTLGSFLYEARVKSSTITDTKHGFFAGLIAGGLIAAGVPIATDGTLYDTNFIGFHRLEGDGDMLDVVWKADGQTQQSLITDAITLVADTWVKIGILYDKQEDDSHKLTFFKNGVPLTTYGTATQMDAATFPDDIALGLTFAVLNATGSTPGNSSIDWHRAVQLRIT